jgi:type VI secretion system protein ImpG
MSYLDYYKQELHRLRESGAEFSKDNPVLASMLDGTSPDPDVERLLEGVAFLTSNINRKLDDDFPEIIHSLLQFVSPQYLKPIPSVTIMSFVPKRNLTNTINIRKGTAIDAVTDDSHIQRFQTCNDIDVHPLKINDVELVDVVEEGAHSELVELKIRFELLQGLSLDNWDTPNLRLYISGDYANACDIYFLLRYYLKEINISTLGQDAVTLPAKNLVPVGFGSNESLLPVAKNVFPSFRILQEYFLFPQKFLFLDLELESWRDRGINSQFTVSCICKIPPFNLPKVNKKSIELFAVPAVNLFNLDADPIQLDHRESEVLISPPDNQHGHYQVYSVDNVYGFSRGAVEKRRFSHFDEFQLEQGKSPIYQLKHKPTLKGGEVDLFMSIGYPPEEELTDQEILSVQLTCSNGATVEELQAGEICEPTTSTPELASFSNLFSPTVSHPPPSNDKLLWKLLSDMSINSNAFSDVDRFKGLLSNYLIQDGKDKPNEIANLKKVNSIFDIENSPENRLFGRSVHRGQSITIKTRSDHYVSKGDMFLFGTIIDFFLGSYSSFNTFTSFTLEDTVKWEKIQWPPRLGTRPLL